MPTVPTDVTDTSYQPLTPEERSNAQTIVRQTARIQELTGGWSVGCSLRDTGASFHFRFKEPATVSVADLFAGIITEAPAVVGDITERLLAADAEVARLRQLAQTGEARP